MVLYNSEAWLGHLNNCRREQLGTRLVSYMVS